MKMYNFPFVLIWKSQTEAKGVNVASFRRLSSG